MQGLGAPAAAGRGRGGAAAPVDAPVALTEATLAHHIKKILAEAGVGVPAATAAGRPAGVPAATAAGRPASTTSKKKVKPAAASEGSSVSSSTSKTSSSSSSDSSKTSSRSKRKKGRARAAAYKTPSRKKILRMDKEAVGELDVRTAAKVPEIWLTWMSALADPFEASTRARQIQEEIIGDFLATSAGAQQMGGAFFEVPFLRRVVVCLLTPKPPAERLEELAFLLGLRLGYVKAAAAGGVRAAASYWKARTDLALDDPDLKKALKKSKKKGKRFTKKK